MSINKMFMIGGVVAGIVVVAAAVGGAIFAANMSSNNLAITTPVEEKAKLNGWQQKVTDWYYYKDDVAQTDWIQDNSNWYYFDDAGKMKLNWVQNKNKWYYLGSDGKMRTGWIQDKGNWYYLNNDGTMATNITVDGCYLNESGIMIDTPAKKAKQIENESTSNSNATNNENMITKNEAIDLIYQNDRKHIISDNISRLEYYGIYSRDQMANIFKHYLGANINEDAYVIEAHYKNEEYDSNNYYVGKESGRLYFQPEASVINEIKNNTIIHKYKWYT